MKILIISQDFLSEEFNVPTREFFRQDVAVVSDFEYDQIDS